MGCGAICGDSTAEQPNAITTAINVMQDLIPSSKTTSPLVSKQTFDTFLELYQQDSKRFYLLPKAKLIQEEQTPDQVLLRWKLILYSQDNDQKSYCSCLGLSSINQKAHSPETIPLQSNLQSTVLYHECFSQIQKDLDRTFSLSGSRKRDFENVLKRIANFFPRMGYTQGINFVVGFLIISGYSEHDSFWIFVHLALNRRILLLGLYEDGFPLCNVFCIVFKNVLKRINKPLYEHLFYVIMVDVSMWVFKWFITCFVYSFPVEMIKYAWEIMIQLGGLGIVSLAISLSNQIGSQLLQKQDMCDLSQFLKKLSQVDFFNQWINLEKVVKRAYQIEITPNDFDGTEEKCGFYGIYFRQNCDIFQKHLKNNKGLPKFQQTSFRCAEMLENWYNHLSAQRLRFHSTRQAVAQVDLQLPVESHEQCQKSLERRELDVKENDLNPAEVPSQDNNLGCSLPNIPTHDANRYKISYHFGKINENLDEDSKSAKSLSSKQFQVRQSFSRKSDVLDDPYDLEELDKLEIEISESKKGITINNYAAPSDLKTIKRKEDFQDRKSLKGPNKDHKMNMKSRNTFTATGQNVLKIDNYDAVSVSSNQNSHKERTKTNQKFIFEITVKNSICKTKTEQNKIIDRKSQATSSKGQFSDKDSLSRSISKQNISHCEENPDNQSLSVQNVESQRQKLPITQTNDNYMICSHGPKLVQSQSKGPIDQNQLLKQKTDTDVQVLPFKKDKKQRKGRSSHINITNGERSFKKNGIIQPSQESLESVPPFSFDHFSAGNICRIEGHTEVCNREGCQVQSIR